IAQYSTPVPKKESIQVHTAVKEATPVKLGYRPHSTSIENINSNVVISRSQYKPQANSELSGALRDVKEYIVESEDYLDDLGELIEGLPKSGTYLTSLDKNLLLLKATSSATMQCLHQCLHILHTKQAMMNHHPLPLTAPSKPRSYSGLRRTSSQHSAPSTAESYCSTTSAQITSNSPHLLTDQKLNGDMCKDIINHEEEVLDETEYKDSDLDGVEEHKSIILHLLSQLKLGMDLTKVVLPTFILERRSLLEMFADCMAHPDLFLKIPEKSDAEERMLTILEWYLTSFHAGRQGSVAKKPYNPIIGETFHCSWEIPHETESTASDDTNHVKTDRLIYCAEQVSHHPPVSAFYFECPSRRVCMNASIWTKSKFMGMSIGVVMVGKVTLHLLDYGEVYTFSLPSAYARSILTVPWVEMGDKITISCPQTNYSSAVVFHTKPFYGGKLHRVTAEVRQGETGDVVCKVQGEWNASLDFNYANGETKSIDVQKLKVWRKRVRPIELQCENESRRLWQHVTKSLSMGDVETATEHKRCLEDKQREGERHRKETNSSFPTKFFRKIDDTWVYKNPLTSQIKSPAS
ncbi:oxysterol-binding protein-related protein 11, partial [Patella vulgata]|uniref:oxysterol-binding protein-related protein 11 n=1 Tax=Patella vulgata TaxID=6465 RepID=UPI0024A82506